jgi:hypothetical protein
LDPLKFDEKNSSKLIILISNLLFHPAAWAMNEFSTWSRLQDSKKRVQQKQSEQRYKVRTNSGMLERKFDATPNEIEISF